MAIRQSFRKRAGVTILAWVVAFLIFFPILWTFLTSFKSELDAIAMPPKFLFFNWTLENYAEVQSRSNYLHYAFNSIALSVGANLVGLAIAIPAAWSMSFAPTIVPDKTLTRTRIYPTVLVALALAAAILWFVGEARSDWRVYMPILFLAFIPVVYWIMTRRTTDVMMWMLSTKMMPAVGVLVPIYLWARDFHLLDSLWGLGFVLMMLNLPILIWMLYTYFKEIPVDILEAARMDGASLFNEIVYVLTPMSVPGIASTMLLAIILSWNEAFWTLNLATSNAAPLTAFIASYSAPEGFFWAKLSAASTLAIAPILVLGWFSQKQLVRGLTFGAVK
jgi:sorbitol/mannitol transport system permease protein